MDLEGIASLVDAAAWPVVAMMALVMFYRPLRGWLKDRPQSLKLGPVEAEWASAAAKTQVALEAEQIGPEAIDVIRDEFKTSAHDEPAASVIQESTSLEKALRRRLLEAGVEDTGAGLAGLARNALEVSLISERTVTAIDGIAAMRNLAVHAPERITAEQASEFGALARSTASAIEAAGRLAENLGAGTGNIRPADIAILLREDKGPSRIVQSALSSESAVKQRQIASALAELGELGAAIDIACAIPNRAEARSVGRAALKHIANLTEDQREEGLQHLGRLRPWLKPPQRRDIREIADSLGVQLPPEWIEAPAV